MASLDVNILGGGFPVPFTALRDLHISDVDILRGLHVPENTLRSLIIQDIGADDVSAVYDALAKPQLLAIQKGAPPQMRIAPKPHIPVITNIEIFNFGLDGSEPSKIYTSIVAHMPHLRKLTGRHEPFPKEAFSRARNTLLSLQHLE
jgi:hypothetical protein